MTALPVRDALPAVREALRARGAAVLVAPPGAGKTTAVAPALLDEPWAAGAIWMLLPRRIAARAAAERMAEQAGERLGGSFGVLTRLDRAVGPATRVIAMTHGVFLNRLLADPELSGVSAVILDEVHERSLDGDLSLALALDARESFRPDLRLLAMSATIDGARFAELLDGPVVESAGRMFPVEVRWRARDATGRHAAGGSDGRERIEDAAARTIGEAMAADGGDCLAFLPGVAEIGRTAERLDLPGVAVHRLHGRAEPAAQRAALAPDREGRRKLVLATAIAETSLTIDGVRIVVDAGLARRPRFDRGTGLTRLVTERASRAAAAQRAGRAGRTAPGVAWRLWAEAEHNGRAAFDPPEMRDADLSGLVLTLAAWGTTDALRLRWLDAPPAAGLAAARNALLALGAADADGAITAHGRAMQRLPLPPRLAHMLVRAGERGAAGLAARVALVLSEPGLGGDALDIEARLAELARRGPGAGRMAENWARMVGGGGDGGLDAATILALGYPERVAKRRRAPGPRDASADYLLANGTGASIDAGEPMARAPWVVVADAGGAGPNARVRLAGMLDEQAARAWIAEHGVREARLDYDAEADVVAAEEVERLGAIVVARRPDPSPDAEAVAAALLAGAVVDLERLPWSEADRALRARAAWARARGADVPDLSDAALAGEAGTWLSPRLRGVRRLRDVQLGGALMEVLGRAGRAALDRAAPAMFETPAGTSHAIDYAAEGGPTVEVRVQALFGLGAHPRAGAEPLVLALTSPGGRVIQTTRDLPRFWAGSWAEVRRELRGRYPKHDWPEDPLAARASLRTKASQARVDSGAAAR